MSGAALGFIDENGGCCSAYRQMNGRLWRKAGVSDGVKVSLIPILFCAKSEK
jgi:hypothetical protein